MLIFGMTWIVFDRNTQNETHAAPIERKVIQQWVLLYSDKIWFNGGHHNFFSQIFDYDLG